MYGLIIKKPWLDKILSEEKTLEVRGSKTKHVGEVIALIESGTSRIRGFCTITENVPLNEDTWEKEREHHKVDISYNELTKRYKTPYVWRIQDVVRYTRPLGYHHPKGAVIWVDLSKCFLNEGIDEFINLIPNALERIYQCEKQKMELGKVHYIRI